MMGGIESERHGYCLLGMLLPWDILGNSTLLCTGPTLAAADPEPAAAEGALFFIIWGSKTNTDFKRNKETEEGEGDSSGEKRDSYQECF